MRTTLLVALALLLVLSPFARSQSISTADTLVLKDVRFEGNTVFTAQRLKDELRDYRGRRITVDDLEDARIRLTRLYVDHQYITSGAVLPDQQIDADNAVVVFKIVEGTLQRGDIVIQPVDAQNAPKQAWIRQSYLTDRIIAGAGTVLNIASLKDRLELVRQNPNIKRINAELQPGNLPGQSRLDVKFEEERLFHFGMEYSNRRPPSVGSTRLELFAFTNDLTRNSDTLSLRYTLLKGEPCDSEFAGLDEFSIGYVLPLNVSDTTLELYFERDDSPVVEAPFDELDIDSRTDSFSFTLRQPIFRTTTATFDYRELNVFASLGFEQNSSELLGEPFSFSPGAENGRTRVAPFRFGQELNFRNPNRAIALRSVFTVGLDLFDATLHGAEGVDSQFLAWLGQFQYVWRVPDTENLVIFRVAGQLANDSLPSLEQFSVGGVETVRGFRENQLVRDQAFAATLEYRHSLLKRTGVSILEIAPFIDAGGGRNVHESITNDSDFIWSIGVGLLFHPSEQFSATVYYGYAFDDFDSTNDLQDNGINFSLIWQPF